MEVIKMAMMYETFALLWTRTQEQVVISYSYPVGQICQVSGRQLQVQDVGCQLPPLATQCERWCWL